MRPAVPVLLLLLTTLLPVAGAAPTVTLEWKEPPVKRMQTGEFEGNLKELKIGEIGLINATIRNDLPVQDVIDITFGGEALSGNGGTRLIEPNFPDHLPGINCDNNNDECRVTIDGNSQRSFDATVEAVAVGSSPMTANASSRTTGLATQDTLQVQVGAFFEPTTVAAPGITPIQIAVISLLGTLIFALRR